ncbi:hypothetical protein, partial [Thiolapillus sp.]|uniref:hypothetical protein n=1 Tax=Thiolapillus sp. TaxID=2017437 RepID=UPI003AF9BE9F
VRRPTLFSLWRKARRENSAASRLLGSTSLRFALHGWQRKSPIPVSLELSGGVGKLFTGREACISQLLSPIENGWA